MEDRGRACRLLSSIPDRLSTAKSKKRNQFQLLPLPYRPTHSLCRPRYRHAIFSTVFDQAGLAMALLGELDVQARGTSLRCPYAMPSTDQARYCATAYAS
eukprot:1026380-Rhodomonas_salina.2